MKLNIKGLVFVGFAAAVFASAAQAADKVVTSKTYVDAKYVGDGTTITMTSPTEGVNAGKNVFSVSGDLQAYTGGGDTTVNNHVITTNVPVKGITMNGETVTPNAQGIVALTGSDTTYSAGTGISISDDNQISATGDITAYTGGGDTTVNNHVITTNVPVKGITVNGTAVTPDGSGIVALTESDTTYSAGTGIDINGTTISATGDITAYTGGGDTTVNNHVITTNVPVKGITVNGTAVTPDGSGIVALGAAAGKAVETAISSTAADNTDDELATAKAVYDFLTTGMTPTGTTCSDTAPCALVLGSGAPTWQPIQQ